ncbi:MAG: HAMP domain-containing sensor histidine kinase [Treponema sp.]|nr:HAMP domain-containing sensor histidine kinase [Treponema sp.]
MNISEILKKAISLSPKKQVDFSEIAKSTINIKNIKNINIDDFDTESISVGIFIPKSKNKEIAVSVKLVLETSGSFCRIFENTSELLKSIDENLIQIVIIIPDNAQDESLEFCKTLRISHNLLEIPVLSLIPKDENGLNSELVEKCNKSGSTSILVRPFDILDIISKIQSLSTLHIQFKKNQDLYKSEKEKSSFLYFVTHNVNTPLTILLNEIHELSKIDFDENTKQMIQNIQMATDQINSVIQNVLTSYRISDGRILLNSKKINLKEFIEIENLFLKPKSERKNQDFIVELNSDEEIDDYVICDENCLKGIYQNIVDNAIKYTPIGGKIKIWTSKKDNFLQLNIADNGRGIPDEKKVKLFKKFSNIGTKPTGKEKTNGLGLYVVYELCKLNNIKIEYSENTEWQTGSIFTLTIPI